MLTKILFILYAGVIPLVPLLGVKAYKKSGDVVKRNICWGLFALQTLVSLGSVIEYVK